MEGFSNKSFNPFSLKYIRKRKKLTQAEVADKAGVERKTVNLWERGVNEPTRNSIIKLAKGLDLSESFFYNRGMEEDLMIDWIGRGETAINNPDTKEGMLGHNILSTYFGNDYHLRNMAESQDSTNNVIDWINPNLLAWRSEAAEQVYNFRGNELIIDGAARCGKTLFDLKYVFSECFNTPNLEVGICRSKEVDLHHSIRTSIRNDLLKYSLDDPMSPIKAVGGHRFSELMFPNGSHITLFGVDRVQKVLGTHFHIILISQAEQITPEEYQVLKSRCSGSIEGWYDEEGNIRFLILGECNPSVAKHHLKLREKEGLTKFISFSFQDNPSFYNPLTDEWSQKGVTVKEELSKSLTGVWRERLYQGIWTTAIGAVFGNEWNDKTHIKKMDKPEGGRWIGAVDWGYQSPSTCLFIHKDDEDNISVYKEIYKTEQTVDDLIVHIDKILEDESIEFEAVVCDHRTDLIETLRRHGYPAQIADKDNIVGGIELIRSRLINKSLTINRDCNLDPDPKIDSGKNPQGIIDEFSMYAYKDEQDQKGNDTDDVPIDAHNHSIDPLRYGLTYFDEPEWSDYYPDIQRPPHTPQKESLWA